MTAPHTLYWNMLKWNFWHGILIDDSWEISIWTAAFAPAEADQVRDAPESGLPYLATADDGDLDCLL